MSRERALIELEARESTVRLVLAETIPHRLASGAYQIGSRAMKGHVGASTEGNPIAGFEVRNASPHTVDKMTEIAGGVGASRLDQMFEYGGFLEVRFRDPVSW